MSAAPGKVTALGLGAALAFGFIWSQRPHPPEAAHRSGVEAIDVRLAAAERGEVITRADATGSLASRLEAVVSARLTAQVLEVSVTAGAEVKAGETLVVLAAEDLAARVAEAEAGLVAAQERLKDAQREWRRTQTLFESSARTQRELDRAATQVALAEAQLNAAAEGLKAARVNLGFATLAAPFDAVVAERMVDPGDLTHPGRPLLRLFDARALRLEAAVDAGLFGGLHLGDSLEVRIDALAGEDGEAQEVLGTLEEIDAAVDPRTRTTLAKIALPTLEGAVPGMFARVSIPVGRREAVSVPRTALVRRGQIEMVFGVEASATTGASPRARMHVVRSGRTMAGDRVEILAGLAGDEDVVVHNAERLRDGAPVRVVGAQAGEGER